MTLVRQFKLGDNVQWVSASVVQIAALADVHGLPIDAGVTDLQQMLRQIFDRGDGKWKPPPYFVVKAAVQMRCPPAPVVVELADQTGWQLCLVCGTAMDPAGSVPSISGRVHPGCEWPCPHCSCPTPWDGVKQLQHIGGAHCILCHDNFSYESFLVHRPFSDDGCIDLRHKVDVDGRLVFARMPEGEFRVWRRIPRSATMSVPITVSPQED